jgi:hypothetical protein
MRRIVALLAISSALVLTACASTPAGVDGDLLNGWGAAPTPASVLPVAGDCYSETDGNMLTNTPTPCAQTHLIEVSHVGTFIDADAAGQTVPAANSSAIKGAYGACVSASKTYLGADFHSGMMTLQVATPDQDAWSGGARWFRCDLSAIISLDDPVATTANAQFKGELATSKTSALRLTCVDWTDHSDYIDAFKQADCAKSHNGEFVGAYAASAGTEYSDTTFQNLAQSGCESMVTKYLGLSGSRDESNTVGWAWSNTDEDAWAGGDHNIRCYAAAFTHDSKFIGSVKGIGLKTAKG